MKSGNHSLAHGLPGPHTNVVLSRSGQQAECIMNNKSPAPLIGIVDDNEEVRQSISSLLGSAGYRSVVFESPAAFLNSPARIETNCVVVNFQVAGLNSLVLRRLQSAPDGSTPIIGIYALEEETRSRALEHGAFEVFGEPFRTPMVTIEPRHEGLPTSAVKQGPATGSGKPFSDVALLSAIRSALKSSRQDPDDLE
jgi:CheY-like chemotaxis protein